MLLKVFAGLLVLLALGHTCVYAGGDPRVDEGGMSRIGWMAISVALFLLGGKLDRALTQFVTGSRRLLKYQGWLVGRPRRSGIAVFIPEKIRREFYILHGSNAYIARIEEHDGVRGHGKLYCFSERDNHVGHWYWTPFTDDENLPFIVCRLHNGKEVSNALERAH